MTAQLNLADPRVEKWYADVEAHSERCVNRDGSCGVCARLKRRNAELHAIPGLEVS